MEPLAHFKAIKLILYLCWIADSVLSQELNNRQNIGTMSDSSYFFYQQPDYPKDCAEARNQCSSGTRSGVYLIKPDGHQEPFEVYCDNTLDSGGWTVIQRIEDGTIYFNRSWTEYKTGFGFLSKEFWLGNDKLSFLTNQDTYELRIDFATEDGLSFYVTYNKFRISDEYSKYKLTSVGEYNGSEDNITDFLCNSGSDGVVFISPDCSSRCNCAGGHFLCDDTYQCSPNAVCEERNDVLQCYCNEGYTGDGVICTADIPPSDCQDVYDTVSAESGVYKIQPTTWQGEPFDVFCNMSDGGGWTVFQRRVDGSQEFNLYWSDYKNGFGLLNQNVWLGNDKLHKLTTQRNYQLRIDFVNSLGNPYYATYSSFRIADESDKYRLRIGSYSGNAGYNSLSDHNNRQFSTRDRDNDGWGSGSCVTQWYYRDPTCGTSCNYRGGWWFGSCAHSSLNSPYGNNCFRWYNLPGNNCNIKYTEMKVRPI